MGRKRLSREGYTQAFPQMWITRNESYLQEVTRAKEATYHHKIEE